MMDAVITFVDGRDPVWQKQYETALGHKPLEKRFRDWGLLRYWFRGIEKNMPFVENVYLVVSSLSQVPSWIDTSVVKVVEHKDIIPQQFLPTFNSTTIEMFLPYIEGLGERWLAFDDDIFPVASCNEEDFFTADGRIRLGFSHHLIASKGYKTHVRNADRAVCGVLELRRGVFFARPQHSVFPLLNSACKEIVSLLHDEIYSRISPVRAQKNFAKALFPLYLYRLGRVARPVVRKKHFSLAVASSSAIVSWLARPSAQLVCINDVEMPLEKFEDYKVALQGAFERLFPEKSRFEL